MTKKILVIVGSNRPIRFGDKIGAWVKTEVDKQATELEFEIVDLKEANLPFLDEPKPPSEGDYVNQHTIDWAKRIEEAAGFIFVTPEYNGGYTAVLKNALDTVYAEWKEKPAAIVSYGAGGGVKMANSLQIVLDHIGMHTLEARVAVSKPWEAFDDDGNVKEENISGQMSAVVAGLSLTLLD